MKVNEEKLTAYALNELPEDERQAFEKELKNNPDARQTVEEIRKLAGQLTEHYTAEENIGLTDEQRETIYAAARKKYKKEKIVPFPRKPWLPMAIAASIGILFIMFSGSLVVFSVIERREQAFCPPRPITRPKMALSKARVKVNKLAAPKASQPIVAKSRQSGPEPQLMEMDSLTFGADKYARITPEPAPTQPQWGPSIEDYIEIIENEFERVRDEPLSTFSIDVDTASYSNMRRFLKEGTLPPKDAVRIEELINYFDYDYEPPHGKIPFATNFDISSCPWDEQHKLVRIGLKGRVIEQAARPALNLVFLLDVSGSMGRENKLPLVKRAMSMLTLQLNERDHVAIVVYAGASGLALPSTSGASRQTILDALNRLESGG